MGVRAGTCAGDDEHGEPSEQSEERELAVTSGGACADDARERVGLDERVERAARLYLQGRRVAEVAAELAVSETTVRRWTRQALLTLAEEERSAQATRLERAIESQRAVAAAAWEAYERERQLDEALLRGDLDHLRRRAIRGGRHLADAPNARDVRDVRDARDTRDARDARDTRDDGDCPPLAMEEYERPKRSAQGPRYLSVALAAQREVARLQGLYARLGQSEHAVSITISRRPDGPENQAPTPETPHDEREARDE